MLIFTASKTGKRNEKVDTILDNDTILFSSVVSGRVTNFVQYRCWLHNSIKHSKCYSIELCHWTIFVVHEYIYIFPFRPTFKNAHEIPIWKQSKIISFRRKGNKIWYNHLAFRSLLGFFGVSQYSTSSTKVSKHGHSAAGVGVVRTIFHVTRKNIKCTSFT